MNAAPDIKIEPDGRTALAHLAALFPLAEAPPATFIEIAWGRPTAAKVNRGRWFPVAEMAAAAAFACLKNRQGANVYVGAALRKGAPARAGARRPSISRGPHMPGSSSTIRAGRRGSGRP